MWASGGLSSQCPADAAASQLREASTSVLPLLPGDGAQPPPDPFVKCAQHRWGLIKAEVATPTDQVGGQLLDDLGEAPSARPSRQLPDLRFASGEHLRRDAPPWLSPDREAEAKELADARSVDRALRFVDLQLEAFGEELFDARHLILSYVPRRSSSWQ
jgi:hypothetical protein